MSKSRSDVHYIWIVEWNIMSCLFGELDSKKKPGRASIIQQIPFYLAVPNFVVVATRCLNFYYRPTSTKRTEQLSASRSTAADIQITLS